VSAIEAPRGVEPPKPPSSAARLRRSILDLRAELHERLAQIPTPLNAWGYDAFGFNRDTAEQLLLVTALLYRYWFLAEVEGIENIPSGRVLLISNHGGQIALDAAMIGTATLLDANPPRIIRGMGEYWLPTVPWINLAMVRTGSVVGTRRNCVRLLDSGECVIAFPEGIRGMNKLIWERYQLKEFGHGFMRLALETNTPIVPIAVVGAEEQAPAIANLMPLARLLGMPAFPITLTFPLLGPLGLVPLPVKYRIFFGEPLHFEGDHNDEDEVIAEKVDVVKARIAGMLARGLAKRRSIFW
jgi:1-acyl-sn-glycerol-3-phosphate acyltransferase